MFRPAGSVSRCDAPLIYAAMDNAKYAALHEHCKGILKPRVN